MKKFFYLPLAALFLLAAPLCWGKDLPKVAILATGGTIAGSVESGIATTGYTAGVLTVETLIKAVPEIQNLAVISGRQVCNIDSSNMTDDIWLELASTINGLLARDIDGVVITHGTDTMEETAYFLNMVVKSDKPVVLVGAMRPATAISADGPKNLYNAVALAASPEAKGKGVMISMDDAILSARDAAKTNTMKTSTFKAPNSGSLGAVIDGVPYFYALPAKPHTTATEFDVKGMKALPKVDILYSYSNDGSAPAAEALVKAGAKGLVIAGSGAGSVHQNQKNALLKLMKNNKTVVVRSSRTGSGLVLIGGDDQKNGFIGADNLNPQKARVLLMLALTKTDDPEKIQEIFNKY